MKRDVLYFSLVCVWVLSSDLGYLVWTHCSKMNGVKTQILVLTINITRIVTCDGVCWHEKPFKVSTSPCLWCSVHLLHFFKRCFLEITNFIVRWWVSSNEIGEYATYFFPRTWNYYYHLVNMHYMIYCNMQESKYTKVCQFKVIINIAEFILNHGTLVKLVVSVRQKQLINSWCLMGIRVL